MKRRRDQGRSAGFTLTELVFASGLSVFVASAAMWLFIWCGRQAQLCGKIGWSQQTCMRTAEKLTLLLRNASEIVAIDEVDGRWVEVAFPDGTTARMVYTNSPATLRDGRLLLSRSGGAGDEVLIARGLTGSMGSDGYTMPFFARNQDNSIRVAYRVAEPVDHDADQEVCDGAFAAQARFVVCLRNVEAAE